MLPGLGVESAARMKREWCVRTRQGIVAPKPGDADFVAGHSYALLATLARKMNGGESRPHRDRGLYRSAPTHADHVRPVSAHRRA